MAIRVRVRNFQSIADSVVDISGLTVVTGQNNSGKSALIRAISAMATNESAKGLLRNGEKTLSVELTFPDGTEVKWEKGGTVNQYTLNGKVFSGVGAGVPEEIKALGLGPIEAGGQEIWPQVASQFKGSLFLLDKSGAVFAEAVSDVERVGLLADASRKAESDARTAKSEYKVRLKDEIALRNQLQKFDGIQETEEIIKALKGLEAKAHATAALYDTFSQRKEAILHCRRVIARYSPAAQIVFPTIPDTGELTTFLRLAKELQSQKGILRRYRNLPANLPDPVNVNELESLLVLRQRLQVARKRAGKIVPEMDLPEISNWDKFEKFLAIYRGLRKAQQDLQSLRQQADSADQEYATAAAAYETALRELGTCPTCGADCGGHQ